MCEGPDIFLILLSVLFPPVGVWVKRGLCSADSIINIALCVLGYFPGLIHAWYIISRYPESNPYDRVADSEGGQVQYYYVASGPGGRQGGYGTLSATSAPAAQFPGQQQSGVVNQQSAAKAFSQPRAATPAAGSSTLASAAAHTSQVPANAATGPSGANEPAPPSYDETVRGDHKVQHD